MSKYTPLWNWIKENGTESFKLSYSEFENIVGFPIDHSFLANKKELNQYGYKVCKISMKEQTVAFEKTVNIGFTQMNRCIFLIIGLKVLLNS